MDKSPEYKVVEIVEGGSVILEMSDGRMFPAALGEGVEIRKGTKVSLKHAESNKDGVPIDATITKAL